MNPPSYPLRPINGGPLPRARPKSGTWLYEPKINGWRAIVNTRTGAMWNRHGKRLSIEREFAEVIGALRSASLPESLTWLDCEALERRHNVGKGSLVILDYMPSGFDNASYEDRRRIILEAMRHVPLWEMWRVDERPKENMLMSFRDCYGDGEKDEAWNRLQNLNQTYNAEFFEGLVAKRANSPYQIQLRSPSTEFPSWVKHRWEY